MKKLMLALFLGLLFTANSTFAEPTYKNGYLIRNAVVWKMYVWDKNWTLLGSMGGSSPYPLKIPDDAFPLIMASCPEPGKGGDECGAGQHQIDNPGCYVLWYWPWGQYYYQTNWACGVGSKAPTSPAKGPALKSDVKKAPQTKAPPPHK